MYSSPFIERKLQPTANIMHREYPTAMSESDTLFFLMRKSITKILVCNVSVLIVILIGGCRSFFNRKKYGYADIRYAQYKENHLSKLKGKSLKIL